MNQSELEHINRLLEEIRISQSWEKTQEPNQRDFEFLIESIFMKTKTRVSLSTMKRIWYRDKEYLPRVSTLDILCQYLDYGGWNSFRIKDNSSKYSVDPSEKIVLRKLNRKKETRLSLIMGGLIIGFGVILYLINVISGSSEDYDAVEFGLEKIVGEDLPVTVVFSYDISGQDFDSAFIQLSWNALERYKITNDQFLLTSMYYFPGLHEAKLIINDSIVKTQPVYIEHDDWLTAFRYKPDDVVPIYIETDKVYQDGFIQASTTLLTEYRADTSKEEYYVSYIRSRDFGVSGDNFSFTTRIKNPATKGKFHCQTSSIYIYTEAGGIYLIFSKPGCVGNSRIIVNDKLIDGRRNDLSALGCDFSQWQDIRVAVKNKHFELFINDSLVLETQYEEEMGKILTWQYFFMGNGAVDNLVIQNDTGETVFYDDFLGTE